MTASAIALSKRLTAILCPALLALALVATAGATGDRGPALRFSFVPQRAFQGKLARVAVSVRPAGLRCSLSFRYTNGTSQAGLRPVRAVRGHAAWTWRVPQAAPIGPASLDVSCGSAGRLSRRVTVIGGSIAPAKVTVQKQGYSQRNDSYGAGSSVSYGLLIANSSPGEDALDVSVLVNFVDASNNVLQTATTHVDGIAAGSTYALGGAASIPTRTGVSRLEVVVEARGHQPKAIHNPVTANLHIVPSSYDKGYVGSVDGEVLNDHPSLELTSANMSVVLLDPAGNIVGGGSGYALASLPSGARSFFSASSGMSAVPLDKAAAAQITVSATYKPAG